MRNIGKHNNCNDETREELEPKLPERQKEDVIHKTVSQSHGGHRTALLRFDATEMTHKNKSLYWKLVATNVPRLATFKTSYQTSAEELLWSE